MAVETVKRIHSNCLTKEPYCAPWEVLGLEKKIINKSFVESAPGKTACQSKGGNHQVIKKETSFPSAGLEVKETQGANPNRKAAL